LARAFITALNEKGIPTPLVHTLMAPPQSRMDVLTVDETRNHIQNSKLYAKYKDVIDNESAYEILNKKMDLIEAAQTKKEAEKQAAKTTTASTKQAPSTLEKMLNNKTTKSLATTATREITRGLLGILIKTFKK
jgi:predicted patatin/cPLA2 family phospholipase